MHWQTRITIDLAVQTLRSMLDQISAGRVDTVAVRLALRCAAYGRTVPNDGPS
jgi:hypothetical protein